MTRSFYINTRFIPAICKQDYSGLAGHERGGINLWLADNGLSFTDAYSMGRAPDGKCAVMGYQPDSLSKVTFKVEAGK